MSAGGAFRMLSADRGVSLSPEVRMTDGVDDARDPGRRSFLRQAAVALSALSVPLAACRGDGGAGGESDRDLQEELAGELLDALADAVLPSEIDAGGRTEAAEGFRAWLDGFEPVAELTHDYGSQAVHYGPEDPGPRWSSQLAALELVARRREDAGFAELPADGRRRLVRRRVPEPPGEAAGRGLPGNPAEAEHVAVGLLAWFYGRPEAADLGYRARIGRYTCRPLEQSGERPAPLSEGDAAAAVRRESAAPRSRRTAPRPEPAS